MEKQSEKLIEKKVTDYAKQRGCMCLKLAGQNNRGKPDHEFLYQSRAMFIEFKSEGKKATPLQLRYIKKLHDQGFQAYVIDNVLTGLAAVNSFVSESVFLTPYEFEILKRLNYGMTPTQIAEDLGKKSVHGVSLILRTRLKPAGAVTHNGKHGVNSEWRITETGQIALTRPIVKYKSKR